MLIFSPIEGIDSDEQEAGIGYLDKMRENIVNLNLATQGRKSHQEYWVILPFFTNNQ